MRGWSNTLRKVGTIIASASLLVSTGIVSVSAQLSANAPPPLNEQILSRFADTWLPITEAISNQDEEFDASHVASLHPSLSALAASDGVNSALDQVVAKFGYSDFEQWANIARVSIQAAQWALQPPTEDELKRTVSALESDPDIPAEQKQSLIKDVSAAFQTALDNKPSDADIAAAKAVMPLLKPIITQGE